MDHMFDQLNVCVSVYVFEVSRAPRDECINRGISVLLKDTLSGHLDVNDRLIFELPNCFFALIYSWRPRMWRHVARRIPLWKCRIWAVLLQFLPAVNCFLPIDLTSAAVWWSVQARKTSIDKTTEAIHATSQECPFFFLLLFSCKLPNNDTPINLRH